MSPIKWHYTMQWTNNIRQLTLFRKNATFGKTGLGFLLNVELCFLSQDQAWKLKELFNNDVLIASNNKMHAILELFSAM